MTRKIKEATNLNITNSSQVVKIYKQLLDLYLLRLILLDLMLLTTLNKSSHDKSENPIRLGMINLHSLQLFLQFSKAELQ